MSDEKEFEPLTQKEIEEVRRIASASYAIRCLLIPAIIGAAALIAAWDSIIAHFASK